MLAAFVKLIFPAAAVLFPASDGPWPFYLPSQVHGEGISVRSFYDGDAIGPGGWIGTPVLRQAVCVKPGVYTARFAVSMEPLPRGTPPVSGWVELHAASDRLLLTTWAAAAGEWTLQANAVTLVNPGCMTLRYAASGPATINPDPRATYLTITRIGD